jgi:peptide/nickel transport system ATP-binding protein
MTDTNVVVETSTEEKKEKLLSIEDLHVWFELRRFGFGHAGYVKAVDGVSFDLNYGQAIAVVGESGCGKSSLMKTILGLNIPTRGDVSFTGKKLSSLDGKGLRWYRSQVGYVQQDPFGALAPFMTVERILEEPLIINGIKSRAERLRRIHKVMEEVKMFPVDDFLGKFPHMLSGGQQQRVVIARAMINEPRLLLADEPTSDLDEQTELEIIQLFKKIHQNSRPTIIMVTHTSQLVPFGTRAIEMKAGGIQEREK